MNIRPIDRGRLSRSGSILVISLTLLTLVSISSLLMARTLSDYQRLNTRRHQLRASYYAAEAGVAQVIHWGNIPQDFTPNTQLFRKIDDEAASQAITGGIAQLSDFSELFPSLSAALVGGKYTIPESLLADFTSEYGFEVSHVKELEILPPAAGDPIPCAFKIRSVGQSRLGSERQILAYVGVNPIIGIRFPSAIQSFGLADMDSNFIVHWGEAWSKQNFDVLGKSAMDYVVPSDSNYDEWAKFRTEGQLEFPSSWQWGGGRDLVGPNRDQPGAAPASGEYENAFFQNVPPGTLPWTDTTSFYQIFREMAIARGRYYSTDSSGNVYRDGIEDRDHEVNFMDEFSITDRDSAPYDMVFIDTIDGQPPAADGSNLATIRIQGMQSSLKGIYWIGAHLDITGVGAPPILAAEAPDETIHDLEKIFIDGVLISPGIVDLSANAGIYGALIAEMGFTGTGTAHVWYNHRLANGFIFDQGNSGSLFRVLLQKNSG